MNLISLSCQQNAIDIAFAPQCHSPAASIALLVKTLGQLRVLVTAACGDQLKNIAPQEPPDFSGKFILYRAIVLSFEWLCCLIKTAKSCEHCFFRGLLFGGSKPLTHHLIKRTAASPWPGGCAWISSGDTSSAVCGSWRSMRMPCLECSPLNFCFVFAAAAVVVVVGCVQGAYSQRPPSLFSHFI